MLCVLPEGSVARWPKILHNNSKGPAKNIFLPIKYCGSKLWPKSGKKGPEIIIQLFLFFSGSVWIENQFFCIVILISLSNIFFPRPKPLKNNNNMTMQNFFCIRRILSQMGRET